jgi:leucine dehydrogenase
MGLAETMSYKFALLDLPRGGGKAVIDLPPGLTPEERAGLLRRYGDLLQSLRGVFQTGADLGTSVDDLDQVASVTDYVFGTSSGAGDPGPTTALGVYAGIRACLEHRFGSAGLDGRRVLVQGLGGVGAPLARRLLEGGAEVLGTDVQPERQAAFASAARFRWVAPEEALSTPCDVFAPCAMSGVLDATAIASLACSAVAGSANNQLARPEDAGLLDQRGILHAPDMVISGGGALYLLGKESLDWSNEEIEARTLALGERLLEIFERAASQGCTTQDAAMELARGRREKLDRQHGAAS